MAEEKGILDGIRVLEIGTFIFGPAAATVLSDFGAEVIKVEHPEGGDPYRAMSSIRGMPVSDINYCFMLDGRNKKSIAIDLKHERGRDVVVKLASRCDVMVTNFLQPQLDKLRLRYEDLKPVNERLIYAQASAHGDGGEDGRKPGYDMTAYWARSSLTAIMWAPGATGLATPPGSGDHPSSMALFGAIMLALYRRTFTGRGSKVSSSLMASGAWANSCLLQAALVGAEFPVRLSRVESGNALTLYYKTRDEQFIAMCCPHDRYFGPACDALGVPDLKDDDRFALVENRRDNMPTLVTLFDEAFAKKDLEEWIKTLESHRIPHSRIALPSDVATDAQMEASGIVTEMDHPKFGTLKTVSSPIFVQDSKKTKPRPAPEVGEHTDDILAWAGYTDQEIKDLKGERAVAGPSLPVSSEVS